MCQSLESPSHTVTYNQYEKEENKQEKLHSIILYNLKNTMEILKYNEKNNIHFYRMTSKLIPLSTHHKVEYNYITPYISYYKEIGDFIEKYNMRVDMHPDQFTVLNGTKKEVRENTFAILAYHASLLQAINIKNPILVLHVGSSVFGKDKSIQRFKKAFLNLPLPIRKMIVLENDDKVFTVLDVLLLCEDLHIPMVLDFHHYICNKGDISIELYYERIFNTWKHYCVNPKIHFSSPKSQTKKDMRSHHNYINSDDFILFLNSIKHLPYDIDIMIEAKQKDEALFRLIRELKYKTHYTFIDDTSFYL